MYEVFNVGETILLDGNPLSLVTLAGVEDWVEKGVPHSCRYDQVRDPLSGDLFLFANRRRTGCKILVWDGTGLCIFMKRLERGQFAPLWREPATGALQLTASELALYVEGCAMVGRVPLSPQEIVLSPLA